MQLKQWTLYPPQQPIREKKKAFTIEFSVESPCNRIRSTASLLTSVRIAKVPVRSLHSSVAIAAHAPGSLRSRVVDTLGTKSTGEMHEIPLVSVGDAHPVLSCENSASTT